MRLTVKQLAKLREIAKTGPQVTVPLPPKPYAMERDINSDAAQRYYAAVAIALHPYTELREAGALSFVLVSEHRVTYAITREGTNYLLQMRARP